MTQDARAALLRLQAQGDHSEAELRASLERRGFSTLQIEDALDWGRAHAAVSDARAADTLIDRSIRKGRGPLRIDADLERRGLDATVNEPQAQTLTRALGLLSKHIDRFSGEPVKAAAWLSRQGYDEDIVRRVVERLIGELPA